MTSTRGRIGGDHVAVSAAVGVIAALAAIGLEGLFGPLDQPVVYYTLYGLAGAVLGAALARLAAADARSAGLATLLFLAGLLAVNVIATFVPLLVANTPFSFDVAAYLVFALRGAAIGALAWILVMRLVAATRSTVEARSAPAATAPPQYPTPPAPGPLASSGAAGPTPVATSAPDSSPDGVAALLGARPSPPPYRAWRWAFVQRGQIADKMIESYRLQSRDDTVAWAAIGRDTRGAVEMLVVAEHPSGAGGPWYRSIYTSDGGYDRRGPTPPILSEDAWREELRWMAAMLTGQREATAAPRPDEVAAPAVHQAQPAEQAQPRLDPQPPPAPPARPRTLAADFAPFRAFAARGSYPQLQSWTVDEVLDDRTVATGGGRIEFWTDAVGTSTFSYPLLAAGFDAAGRIAAIVAAETLPEARGVVYLGMFRDGRHDNHGPGPWLDPSSFGQRAVSLLSPILVEHASRLPAEPPPTAEQATPGSAPERREEPEHG